MKRILLITSLLYFSLCAGFSQQTWSLDKCIDYAIKNNIQLKQQQLNVQGYEGQALLSKAQVLPSVNASASDNHTFGRSVDRFTNEFSTEKVHSVNLSANASMTLFRGFQNYNTIQQTQYNLLAVVQDMEKFRNDIMLNIAVAYLQVLYSEELLETSKKQLEITQLQVTRTEQLVNAGSLAKGSLLEIQSQKAIEELNTITADNQVKSSYLQLTQMLELDSTSGFKIERTQLREPQMGDSLPSVSVIYNDALKLPQIKGSEYRLLSSQKSYAIALGRLSPSLSLSAGLNSGYSDKRTRTLVQPTVMQTIGFVEGTNAKVLSPITPYTSEEYPFADQIKDNQSKSLSLNLSVPIFNNWQTMTGISNAKISIQNSKYQLQLAKNQLYKDIQQAYNDALAARTKYVAAKKSFEANKESFSYSQEKFNVGMVNSVDYNTSKIKLAKAESDLLQSKYEYVFKKNVLNFYRKLPIKLE